MYCKSCGRPLGDQDRVCRYCGTPAGSGRGFCPQCGQPTQPDANSNSAATGKFMTWFFPLFSLWICWSSTAAFSIYWVFVNVWTIVTTFFINKLIDRKEAAGGQTTKEELNP